MASVAHGVFQGGLPWIMAAIGAVIAFAIIAFDQYQASRGAEFRTPVLAVAVGIYLPLSLSVPIFIGGLVAHAATKTRARMGAAAAPAERFGLLFASGLITGEAMVGILLAIPLVAFKRNAFALTEAAQFAWPGMILLVAVLVFLYRSATAKSEPA
jgi:putative OPT family oligopeptide transporter